ncbi:MAG: cobalt-precorrin 5A hydrolase [Anaerocolumna sp.]
MKLCIVTFTAKGSRLGSKLCEALKGPGHVVKGYGTVKYTEKSGLLPFTKLSTLLEEIFFISDGIIFIGACGIAVRGVAPFLHHKGRDPGVVVVDECGTYAISLLSGHIGGGNLLCEEVANIVGAIPVITTATDVNNVFSVDNFAKAAGLWIKDINQIKTISSAILDGEEIGFYSEYPVIGELPNLLSYHTLKKGICIAANEMLSPFSITMNLIPRDLVLGIGCKKNTRLEAIEELISEVLEHLNLKNYRIGKIASINIKAFEPGILEYARRIRAEFITYTAEELNQVQGKFAESAFVIQTVGVGNVCERSGALASENGIKILGKTTKNGVAVSLYQRKFEVKF